MPPIVSPESSMNARSGSSKYGSDAVPEPWCSLACLWVSQLNSAMGSTNLDVKLVNLGLFFVLKYSFLDGHESAPSCTGSFLSRSIHVPRRRPPTVSGMGDWLLIFLCIAFLRYVLVPWRPRISSFLYCVYFSALAVCPCY